MLRGKYCEKPGCRKPSTKNRGKQKSSARAQTNVIRCFESFSVFPVQPGTILYFRYEKQKTSCIHSEFTG